MFNWTKDRVIQPPTTTKSKVEHPNHTVPTTIPNFLLCLALRIAIQVGKTKTTSPAQGIKRGLIIQSIDIILPQTRSSNLFLAAPK